MVVILPLALGGLAATIRTRLARGSRRLSRAARRSRVSATRVGDGRHGS